MMEKLTAGPLTAILRECWILASSLKYSAGYPHWTAEPIIHAIVVESVMVEEPYRRQGHLRRFLEQLCADTRFELVVIEAVQNPLLAEALMRWGWDCDPQVMDFYRPREGA
jgi:GNAT superfamily N-acetyltransferase